MVMTSSQVAGFRKASAAFVAKDAGGALGAGEGKRGGGG